MLSCSSAVPKSMRSSRQPRGKRNSSRVPFGSKEGLIYKTNSGGRVNQYVARSTETAATRTANRRAKRFRRFGLRGGRSVITASVKACSFIYSIGRLLHILLEDTVKPGRLDL